MKRVQWIDHHISQHSPEKVTFWFCCCSIQYCSLFKQTPPGTWQQKTVFFLLETHLALTFWNVIKNCAANLYRKYFFNNICYVYYINIPDMNSAERAAGLCSWCYSLALRDCNWLLADPGNCWRFGYAPLSLRISSAPALPRWGPVGLTGKRCSEWWGAESQSWSESGWLVPLNVGGMIWGDAEPWSNPSSSASPSRWQSGAFYPGTWIWTSLLQKRICSRVESGEWDEVLQGY